MCIYTPLLLILCFGEFYSPNFKERKSHSGKTLLFNKQKLTVFKLNKREAVSYIKETSNAVWVMHTTQYAA